MSGAKDDIFYFDDGDDQPVKTTPTKPVASISKNLLDQSDQFDFEYSNKKAKVEKEYHQEKKQFIYEPGARKKSGKLPSLTSLTKKSYEVKKEISIQGYKEQPKKFQEEEVEEKKIQQSGHYEEEKIVKEDKPRRGRPINKNAKWDEDGLEEVELSPVHKEPKEKSPDVLRKSPQSPQKQSIFEKKNDSPPIVQRQVDLESDPDSPHADANNDSDRPQIPSKQPPAMKPITIGQINNRKQFLSTPIQQGRQLQLTIKRQKGGLGLFPQYDIFLSMQYRYMMTAKKRSGNATSNYLITSDKNELDPNCPSYMGKVRSNFMGTNFQIYDDGCNPEKKDEAGKRPRRILASVHYASNIFGSKGPRKMEVYIPDPKVNPLLIPEKDIKEHWDKEPEKFVPLMNKPPKWNEAKQIYMLDFKGRVDKPSVKNFILVRKDTQEPYILLFGRVGEDVFHLDVMHPLSPLQALGIVMTSFDTKLACQ